MKHNYCTLFDRNYLPHVLSLHESLEKNDPEFVLYCFCMDDESFNYLQNIKKKTIFPISYQKLESHFTNLNIAKTNRSRVEYYFTCSSAICSYILECYTEIEQITYLDADLYFFSSPDPIFLELKDASIGIIEHRFSFFAKKYEKYGKFNVGWVTFRNDFSGRKCLEDWRSDCLDWCYDRLENGKFADQKYLDYWPNNYSGVHIIKHLGANVAPWNVGRFSLKIDIKTKHIKVNDQSLIFYHFASFKQVDVKGYISNVSKYFVVLSGILRNNIYSHYLERISVYNDILCIKFNIKDRKEVEGSRYLNRIKQISRSFRQLLCKDYIEKN